MYVMVRAFPSPRRQAEELADAHYERLRREVTGAVMRRLAASKVELAHADLDAAYNRAWHAAIQMIAKREQIVNLPGLLVDVTYKRALDIFRQRHEVLHAVSDLESCPVETDMAALLDEQGKIQGLIARLKERLNENERRAVTLCVLQGYRRPEAARILGFKEPAFQKIMDSATKKIGMVVAGMEARGCGDEEWASALRSFALGVMSEDHRDYPRIQAHLAECSSCRRYVYGLRGMAAIFVPVGLRFRPFDRVGPAAHLLGALRRLVGWGHSTSSAAPAASMSGASTSALGAGSVKVAVGVIASVAIAGAGLKLSTHDAHHRAHPPRRVAVKAAAPVTAAGWASSEDVPHRVTALTVRRGSVHAHPRRHRSPSPSEEAQGASREFGIENPPASPPKPKPAATQARTRTPTSEGSSETGEFGFEQRPEK
jgi:DNA-directed RNA polymerase specialized sigma24 family protein